MHRPSPPARAGSCRRLAWLLLVCGGAASASTTPDPRDGWRQEFSPSWEMTTFWRKEGSNYTIHSIGVGYLGSVGATGPFLHLSYLFPLQVRQDGKVHAVSSIYDNAGGIDLLLGWQWRTTISDTVEVESGPGFHLDLYNMGGKAGLTNFNAMQLGVGGMGIVRWRPGWKPGNVGWTVGAVGSLALDFADPLRSNDLKLGVVVRLGALVGVDLP
jgi:hypothetical protein